MPRDGAELTGRPDAFAPPFLSSLASNRLSRRFGLSPTAAAAIASLAGLGPQEVRQ